MLAAQMARAGAIPVQVITQGDFELTITQTELAPVASAPGGLVQALFTLRNTAGQGMVSLVVDAQGGPGSLNQVTAPAFGVLTTLFADSNLILDSPFSTPADQTALYDTQIPFPGSQMTTIFQVEDPPGSGNFVNVSFENSSDIHVLGIFTGGSVLPQRNVLQLVGAPGTTLNVNIESGSANSDAKFEFPIILGGGGGEPDPDAFVADRSNNPAMLVTDQGYDPDTNTIEIEIVALQLHSPEAIQIDMTNFPVDPTLPLNIVLHVQNSDMSGLPVNGLHVELGDDNATVGSFSRSGDSDGRTIVGSGLDRILTPMGPSEGDLLRFHSDTNIAVDSFFDIFLTTHTPGDDGEGSLVLNVTLVPVPAAAWMGLALMGAIAARRRKAA